MVFSNHFILFYYNIFKFSFSFILLSLSRVRALFLYLNWIGLLHVLCDEYFLVLVIFFFHSQSCEFSTLVELMDYLKF